MVHRVLYARDIDGPIAFGAFKSLLDGLNYQNFADAAYEPTYFDIKIVAMHFYHNQVFIYKGINDEPSFLIDLLKKRLITLAEADLSS